MRLDFMVKRLGPGKARVIFGAALAAREWGREVSHNQTFARAFATAGSSWWFEESIEGTTTFFFGAFCQGMLGLNNFLPTNSDFPY